MSRYFVFIGLIQGGLLLLFHEAILQKWPVISEPSFVYPAYALVLITPIVGMVCSQLNGKRQLAHLLIAVSMLLLLLGWYSGYSALPITSDSFTQIFIVSLAMLVLMFVGLPFLQSYLKSNQMKPAYDNLYEFGWSNTLVFIMAWVFTNLVWGLLSLWAALFNLLDIEMFSDLFYNRYFVYPATGVMFTYGISLGLEKFNIKVVQRVDFFFRAITVLVALIIVLFLLALLVSGLEPLWKTKSATFLLLWLQVIVILFVNGMFQQGYHGRKELILVRWSVSLSLLALPLFSVISVYAMYLRVEQYGWTIDRVWAVIITFLLAIYALGYAAAAVRGFLNKGSWLAWMAPTNIIAALTILLMIMLTHSPLLSPTNIAVYSQITRLMEGKVKVSAFDFRYLRFDTGARGLEKLKALSVLENHPESKSIQSLAKQTLALERRWGNAHDKNLKNMNLTEVRKIFSVYPLEHEFEESLQLFIHQQRQTYPYVSCFSQRLVCKLLFVDLNQDGVDEAIMYTNNPEALLQKRGGTWVHIGGFYSDFFSLTQAPDFSKERVVVASEHEWQRLRVGSSYWTVLRKNH